MRTLLLGGCILLDMVVPAIAAAGRCEVVMGWGLRHVSSCGWPVPWLEVVRESGVGATRWPVSVVVTNWFVAGAWFSMLVFIGGVQVWGLRRMPSR